MIFVLYFECLIGLCNTPCMVSMDNELLPHTGYDSFAIYSTVTTHQHPNDEKKGQKNIVHCPTGYKPLHKQSECSPLSPERKETLKTILPTPVVIRNDDRMKTMYDQAS